jgi:predicted  nucleic acid-binding Zn-ribbon protein
VGVLKDNIKDLNDKIKGLEKQLEAMTKEAKTWEREHNNIYQDRETTVKMLSQKIIGLEKLKDDDLKNYTVSMRQIEDEAKTKLDDLHTAI